ncbi:MAG TPA: PAS domain S-box protein [Burkholderiales bacterium]|nr:PAS domain S-box protein [Burkholderiales bacterium]
MTAPPASTVNQLAYDACKNAPHGLVVLDDSVVDCNERFCRMIGAAREELLGAALLALSPEVQSDGAFSRERWQRRWHAAQAGLPQWFPWQFRNRSGKRVHALVHLTGDNASGSALLAHVHDLSNLSEVGWIQRETQDRLQQVLDRTKAVIFVKDRAGRYVFANRELERVVRVPAEKIVGRTDLELWPPAVAAHFQMNDAQVLTQGSGTEFEVTVDAGRERKTFLSFKFPLCSADGEPYGVCGIATDITETKRTQDALTKAALAVSSAQGASVFQELVRYLATILEVDGALIAEPCEDGSSMRVHALFFDGEVQQNFEYPSAGSPCAGVVGQSFKIYSSGVRETFPGDVEFEKLKIESYAGFPLTDGSGKPIGLISVLSRAPMSNAEFIESILKIFAVRAAAELERLRSEETLRRSEASYRAIFEASEDAIFIHDWDTGAVIDVNRRACEVTGYTYEEMKRISVAELSSGEHPYTGEEAAKRIEEAKSGNPVRFEWRRRRKDGSLHWDEVVLRPAVIAGERRIVAFTREITERKHAEQALRQAQKMEALGHLTGGIAHDFNNLLTSIMGYITLAADHPAAAGDAKLGKYLDQAGASCGRARDLIQQMLTFSRGQRGQPRPVSLQALVEQSVGLFGPSLPATIAIEKQLEAEVPAVMLDPVHLDQILLNLCLNARDAMSGSGAIRLSIAASARCGDVCTACRQHASGEFVELTVEDSGHGIAPEIIDRIFEPFFSTKEVGKGSGMGLASVHGIVHETGGHIVVDSTPGRGTRFRVLFPALPDAADTSAAECGIRACGPQAQLRGRVLVVDDEQAVGTFMGDLLECWGLEVTVSTSPAEAASLFCEDSRRFDLVITDQVMPRKTGVELARELLAIRPDLPIILYTGYNADARHVIDAAGLRAVVSKPVDPHALFGLLQSHLP